MWHTTLLLIFALAILYSSQGDSHSRAGCPKYIGTSPNGRFYFMDNSTKHSWYEARDLCQECGYKLAEINSMEQNHFLASILWDNEDRAFWTSARESRNNINYFAWDESSKLIEDVYNLTFDGTGGPMHTPYTICGLYELHPNYNETWIVAKGCNLSYSTLCMLG